MRSQSITVSRDKPPNERAFSEYVQSGSWQCSKGGGHHWVQVEGDKWRCVKCGIPREFKCSDYDLDSSLAGDVVFGVAGLFDASQRSWVY